MSNVNGTRYITLGNLKGGVSKSTTAVHLIVALQREGFRVGAIDLDSGTSTLARYFENRRVYVEKNGMSTPLPHLMEVGKSTHIDREQAEAEELALFRDACTTLNPRCDVVVIDTPGADTYLSRLAHAAASILITPMSASTVDLDVLARFNAREGAVTQPGAYAQLVYEAREIRKKSGSSDLTWLLLVNRFDPLQRVEDENVFQQLLRIGEHLNFSTHKGFAERKIFRTAFPLGLTLFDIQAPEEGAKGWGDFRGAELEMEALMQRLMLPDEIRKEAAE